MIGSVILGNGSGRFDQDNFIFDAVFVGFNFVKKFVLNLPLYGL